MYYISDINGLTIEISDLDKSIIEAKEAVHFHFIKRQRKKKNSEEIIFPEAEKDWNHRLLELQKLKLKLNHC